MYRARLNFHQMQRRLDFLLKRDLIKEGREGERVTYEITERGKIFLEHYKKLLELKEAKKPE